MALLDFATDPQNAMLNNIAFGLLSASGPSTHPVSLGQALGQAGQMGMQGYQQGQENQIKQIQLDRLKSQLEFQKGLGDQNMGSPDFLKKAISSGAIDLNTALPLMMRDNKTSWQDAGDKLVQLDAYGKPTGASMPKGIAPSFQHFDTGGGITTGVMTSDGFQPTGTLKKGVSPDAVMTDQRQRELNGILANGQLSQNVETAAQAIANGQLPALSGFAMKTPYGQQTMARVMQINPNYNAADFGSQSNALKQFTSGKLGNSVRSFNVSISHLDTLSNLADALDNGNTQLINRVGNEWATQTGQAAPTDFNAAKKIVGDEIVKAIVGAGGGVSDREEAAKTINAANSPAQLRGVINTYKELMRGQLGGLQQQYEQSTGRTDFDRFLSPAAQQEKKAPTNLQNVTDADLRNTALKYGISVDQVKQRLGMK